MQYSGYSEGTFSAQINDLRIRNSSLERQVILLTHLLQEKDATIVQLQSQFQHSQPSDVDNADVESEVKKTKTK